MKHDFRSNGPKTLDLHLTAQPAYIDLPVSPTLATLQETAIVLAMLTSV